jgi:hypothetical protein
MATMLVLSALVSTHLVTYVVATIMYLLLVNHPIGLIGQTKSSPHFINGSYGKVVTNLTKLCIAKPLALWHASQHLQNFKNHEITWATDILH